jgi:hypothetical protein
MVEEGIWRERRRKFARIYQRRMRRPSYGELIQIDGSPHDWFEGRGPKCTLIVFIDDATSALMALRFVLQKQPGLTWKPSGVTLMIMAYHWLSILTDTVYSE